MAFINGSMVLDHFYYGAPWTIGLRRFRHELKEHDMNFYFRPLRKESPFLIDLPNAAIPDFTQRNANCQVKQVEVIPEYKVVISL